jgi:hypothetical protein
MGPLMAIYAAIRAAYRRVCRLLWSLKGKMAADIGVYAAFWRKMPHFSRFFLAKCTYPHPFPFGL